MRLASKSRIFTLLLSFLLLSSTSAHADALGEIEEELTPGWLVTVTGETRTRILRVHGVDQKSEGVFELDADYGWIDDKKGPATAEVTQSHTGRKLIFTTQSGSKVDATQDATGAFSGSFKYKSGVIKGVRITKLSQDELYLIQKSDLNAAPKIENPGAEIPATCAAFLGGWTGTLANTGRLWLWVVSVGSDCLARYYQGKNAGVPTKFNMAQIRNGVMTIPLANGKLEFELRGIEVVRSYSGSNGKNSSVMHRVNTTDDSLGKLRAEQGADLPRAIPLTPNVPANCAPFFGSWAGSWSRIDNSDRWLHVHRVDEECFASYSYLKSTSTPRVFYRVEIKLGSLSFRCSEKSLAVCTFRLSGNALNASYSVAGGNPTTGVFRRVK